MQEQINLRRGKREDREVHKGVFGRVQNEERAKDGGREQVNSEGGGENANEWRSEGENKQTGDDGGT